MMLLSGIGERECGKARYGEMCGWEGCVEKWVLDTERGEELGWV